MSKSFTIHIRLWMVLSLCVLGLSMAAAPQSSAAAQAGSLDDELQSVLRRAGFTGRIEVNT